jgi:hypothetical protein
LNRFNNLPAQLIIMIRAFIHYKLLKHVANATTEIVLIVKFHITMTKKSVNFTAAKGSFVF